MTKTKPITFLWLSATCLLLLVLGPIGCASNDSSEAKSSRQTLKNFVSATQKREQKRRAEEETIAPVVRLQDDKLVNIEKLYQNALDVAKDEDVRHKILLRLADIRMLKSEDQQVEANNADQFYDEAIDFYEELIPLNDQRVQDSAEQPNSARLIYQLAKAYALNGELEKSDAAMARLIDAFPQSPYATEAYFRRGEFAFSNNDYQQAAVSYTRVVAEGEGTDFFHNARYMLGWSRFKQNRLDESAESFTALLNDLYSTVKPKDGENRRSSNLVADTIRVMGVISFYEGGIEAIEKRYPIDPQYDPHQAEPSPDPAYLAAIYKSLAELYERRELEEQAIDSYLAFVSRDPIHPEATDIQLKAIAMLDEQGLDARSLNQQEVFVTRYGVDGIYKNALEESKKATLRPILAKQLAILATAYHADAQDAKADNVMALMYRPTFLKAAGLYNQLLRTDKEVKDRDVLRFRMAEALYDGGSLNASVDNFEALAYGAEAASLELPVIAQTSSQTLGADAGFSALQIRDELIATFNVQNPNETARDALFEAQTIKLFSAEKFAQNYPDDARTPAVLTDALALVYKQNNFAQTISIAEQVLSLGQTSAEQKLNAQTYLANAHFELENYPASEAAYANLLSITPLGDPSITAIEERLAASMYRVAQTLIEQAGQPPADEPLVLGINKYLSIQSVLPDHPIAITAQFEAAEQLFASYDRKTADRKVNQSESTVQTGLSGGDYQTLESLLLSLAERYPNNSSSKAIRPKLIVIYERESLWGQAATQLTELSSVTADQELAREASFRAAAYYERAKDNQAAIDQYGQYIARFTTPVENYAEALYRQTELLELANNTEKARNNYKKLASLPGDNARLKYLKGYGAIRDAREQYDRFASIRLTWPIKKSLAVKKEAMNSALSSYQAVLESKVPELVTEANYHIALIYATLSEDLIDSEPPDTLDDLALEQYDIILEEQAYPFEEKAIELFETNARRSSTGLYDNWVKRSFASLAKLLPVRFGKKEHTIDVSETIQ